MKRAKKEETKRQAVNVWGGNSDVSGGFQRRLAFQDLIYFIGLNDLMESKGGKKKSSSSSSSKSLCYEAPLGYSIEDLRPAGGIKKFRSAAYSNCVRKPS
ncbi:hypothetical protein Peur_064226 [Populus x canadensis]